MLFKLKGILFSAIILLNVAFTTNAQHFIIGKIVEEGSKEPLAFVHVIANNGENHAFSDIEGKFRIKLNKPIHSLTFKKDLHETKSITDLLDHHGLLNIKLKQTSNFTFTKETKPQAKKLIENILLNKKKHNPIHLRNYSYQTYNKLTLTSGKIEEVQSKASKLLNKLKITNNALNNFKHDHHLLLMESVTERKFLNHFNHKEIIDASKVSGIEKPTVFTVVSQFQPFSIYENHITLAGSSYYGPLIPNALKWYHFEIVDSAKVKNDTIYTVKFNPWWEKRIEFLKGYFMVNTSDYNIKYVSTTPAIHESVDIEFTQSYKKIDNQIWFPYKTKTAILKDRFATNSAKIDAIDRTTIFNVKINDTLKRKQFDDLVLDYKNDVNEHDELYWNVNRKDEFSIKDLLTYTFYDSVGSIKDFEKLIRIGESLYYGNLPFKWVDLDMHRIFKINEFEGMRLGLALHTNNRVSGRFKLGGYYGYGLKDKNEKYGGDFKLKITKKKPEISVGAYYLKDLAEAGKANFSYDKFQFSKENIREILVTKLDEVEKRAVSLEIKPFKYLSINSALVQSKETPLYSYRYNNEDSKIFNYGEFQLGLKYAYGEHFVKIPHGKLGLSTKLPVLWLQLTKGYDDLFDGEFNFTKLDFKIQHSFKFIGFGTSSFQLAAGLVNGDVPYSRLFNGKGSFKPFSAVVHNSFETMEYNEFISDRYVALFYSHNFGRMHIRKSKKQPYFILLHNMGWGELTKPDLHQDIAFNTMDRIYIESGAFLDNIFVLNGFGFSLGLGAGIFLRYGYYAHDRENRNIVGKIAINLGL